MCAIVRLARWLPRLVGARVKRIEMNRRTAIVTLLSAWALITLVGIAAAAASPAAGTWVGLLIISLSMAQGSLLGIWAGLGGKPSPWRLVGTVVALVALAWALEAAFGNSSAAGWAFLVLIQAFFTAPPLLALQFMGLGLKRSEAENSAVGWHKFQFSLRSLLEWTAAVAILLSAVQMMPEEFRTGYRWREWAAWLVFFVDGLLALAGLWIALGTRRLLLRIVLMGIGCVGATAAFTLIDAADSLLLLFPALYACWVVSSLYLCRLAGYRLVWRASVTL